MIKRANKLTSLLLAAATATSLMPTVGANASERLGTKEGTIEKAYAFKDGKYIYEGYRTDDDDNSVYYNSGEKDKDLGDDLEDAELNGKYSTNTVISKDGDDEYLIDLSNGHVTDDDLASDDISTAANKLESKLKRTDRYERSGNDKLNINDDQLTQVTPNQFGEVWYQYQSTTAGAATPVYGYTNKSGNYIDCNVTANLRVFNGTKMIKIDEFDDKTDGITATLNGEPLTIAQDKDYFYRIIDVKFTTDASVSVANLDNSPISSSKYLQRISKAQGGDEKDADLPKSVESYQLIGENKTTGKDILDDDSTTAYEKLTSITLEQLKNDDKNDNSETFVGVKVVDGKIYYTCIEGDKVKTYKLKLQKNEKVDITKADNDKIRLDAYIVKYDDDIDQDVEGRSGVSIDVDGNVWVIDKGDILRSEKGGDFKLMYTCDRSLDCLDVYDSNNLIAWDSSGDVYTTVQEGSKATKDETTPDQVGWVKNANGTSSFFDASGKQVKHNWVNSGGRYYYLNDEGAMESNKWVKPFGNWYLLNADGTMASSTWNCSSGIWYYLNGNGNLLTGWQYINGSWYYMNSDGAMQTGWQYLNGSWYYLQPSGAMKTGWFNDNGTWYYLSSSGAMLSNTTVDGYRLASNGAWIR